MNAGWSIRMPENYTPFFSVPPEKKRHRQFEEAARKTARIAAAVRLQEHHRLEDSFLPLRIVGWALGPFRGPKMYKEDKKFKVTDACTGCRRCARVCPVDNIKMVDGKPVWQHHCENCLACMHWCPVGAINMGKRSARREHYHHPEMTPDDIAAQSAADES